MRNNRPDTTTRRVATVLAAAPDKGLTTDDIRAALQARGWAIPDEAVADALSTLYHRGELLLGGSLSSRTEPRRFTLASRARPGAVAAGSCVGAE